MTSHAKPPDVAILLSVFNGDRFIREQLESIGAQTAIGWSLTWRDDGGDPGRACDAAMAAFAARFPGKVRETPDSGRRLGVCGSYMALLAAATDAPYVAFADQDDVWLPDKLARAAERLSIVPDGTPALYCGRQRLVDASLGPLGLSKLPVRPLGFGNALVQNVATGCTVVLNRAACLAVRAMPAPGGTLHDWWCYLVVAGIGGRLIYDPEPFILYRQHDANVVGSAGGRLRRGWRALRRGPSRFLHCLDLHLRVLEAGRDRLTANNQLLLDALCATRARPAWRRLRALSRSGVYRHGIAEDLILRLWLLFGRGREPRP